MQFCLGCIEMDKRSSSSSSSLPWSTDTKAGSSASTLPASWPRIDWNMEVRLSLRFIFCMTSVQITS